MLQNLIRSSSAIVLTLLTLSIAVNTNAQCSVTCTLLWEDEFNGSAVDLTKWEFQIGDGTAFGIPGWGNNELQYYRAENSTVANGELTITAKNETFGGKNYTSSRLRTLANGDWTYGRFEMRAKLPSSQGSWPAFWMLSSTPATYGFWPASGEIDIVEQVSANPDTIINALHFGNAGGGSTFLTSTYNLAAGTAGNYHVYALEWEPGVLRWYIDGVLVETRSSWFSSGGVYPAPFDVPFHLLLNHAVGGNLGGTPNPAAYPSDYVIDYVRVYSLPDTVIPDPPDPSLIFVDDFEHGDPGANNWFAFGTPSSGGGVGPSTVLPPTDGGSFSMSTGWGSGGVPGYLGVFGRNIVMDLTNATDFSFWINPATGQDYKLELNIQDDDNGDGVWSQNIDDEFQYTCTVSASGPCAIAGGGWQRIDVPIAGFEHDTTYSTGGTGVLDSAPGGNGQVVSFAVAVITNSGADVNFDTDYWVFMTANIEVPEASIPIFPTLATIGLGAAIFLIGLLRRRPISQSNLLSP